MTLAQFQTALAELISQPGRLDAVRALGGDGLGTAQLDERERRRLVALARDPRLEVAVMLHVRRRLAAVLTALPHSCRLLGDGVVSSLLREYRWAHPPRSTYFADEGLEFARFLGARDELDPFVADVLALEVAVLEIHLEEEREPDPHPRLAPRSRLVDTQHDPEQLASVLRGGPVVPPVPTRRAHTMLLRQTGDGEVGVEVLDPRLASVLRLCTGEGPIDLSRDDFAALGEAGYITLS
jgi:hypothetical protein